MLKCFMKRVLNFHLESSAKGHAHGTVSISTYNHTLIFKLLSMSKYVTFFIEAKTEREREEGSVRIKNRLFSLYSHRVLVYYMCVDCIAKSNR